MAYVHCHGCNWEQDDFWSLRHYNPLNSFIADLKWAAWPKMLEFDLPPHSYGRIFSWCFLWKKFLKTIRNFRNQVWWTYRDWNRAVKSNGGHWPKCPKCGHALCID
jgi:hypothetical protein